MESLPSELRSFTETALPDGLYVLHCCGDDIEARGVVHKSGIRIYGGGEHFACFGTVLNQGNAVSAQIEIQQEGTDAQSVFGPAEYVTLRLAGVANEHGARMHGESIEEPSRHLAVTLRFLRE